MPDISIRIQVGEVVEIVYGVETQLEDPSILMRDWLLLMLRSTQLTFQEGGRPAKWTSLAMSTIEGRLRRDAGGRSALKGANAKLSGKAAVKAQEKFFVAVGSIQILRDIGRLLMSVGGSASGAFEDEQGFGESDTFTATIGTNHPGAEALQFVIAGGRPFLIFQNIDEEDGMDMTKQFVMQEGPYAV